MSKQWQKAGMEGSAGGGPKPPMTGIGYRLAVARRLSRDAPEEISDGVPVQWMDGPLTRSKVHEWWRAHEARGAKRPSRVFFYLHVPFCRSRCSYCQFPSRPVGSHGDLEGYVDMVLEEASAFHEAVGPVSVDAATVGGGTPSVLSPRQLERLLGALAGRVFEIDHADQFSVESNPDSVTVEKLEVLANAGVNRLSLGVQSFARATLDAVGRGYQSREVVARAVDAARRFDFQLSIDMLAPLPHEDPGTFEAGLDEAFDLEPDQVFLYRYQRVAGDPSGSGSPSMSFREAAEAFESKVVGRGYNRTWRSHAGVVAEAPGAREFRSGYNQHPWQTHSMLGFGSHSESHVFCKGTYRTEVDESGHASYRGEETDHGGEMSAFLARCLGSGQGVSRREFRDSFGVEPGEAFPRQLAFLSESGEVVISDDSIRLSPGTDRTRAWLFFDSRTMAHIVSRAVGRDGRSGPPGETWDRIGKLLGRPVRAPRVEGAMAIWESAMCWLDATTDEATVQVCIRLEVIEDSDVEARWLAALRGLMRGGERSPMTDLLARLIASGTLEAVETSVSWVTGRDGESVDVRARFTEPSGSPMDWLIGASGVPDGAREGQSGIDRVARVRIGPAPGRSSAVSAVWHLREDSRIVNGLRDSGLLPFEPAAGGPEDAPFSLVRVAESAGPARLEVRVEPGSLHRASLEEGRLARQYGRAVAAARRLPLSLGRADVSCVSIPLDGRTMAGAGLRVGFRI